VNLSSLYHHEEKEMSKVFHIKIQVNMTKIDALSDSSSQDNLIETNMVSNIGLEDRNHPSPYPLGRVNKDAKTKVTK
jgi:hypothetical protein